MKPVFLICLFLLLVLPSHQAFAYIDPGSGSYVLQMIVAAFFAIVFTLKMFWRSIRLFFSRFFSKNQDGPGAGNENS